jgi:hypothetical protein
MRMKTRMRMRRRMRMRGGGFADELRTKTRRSENKKEEKRPRVSDRQFSPPKFRDNGKMIDPEYGPNRTSFYGGPSYVQEGNVAFPHGKTGVILYSSGHQYVGDFKWGKKEGDGKFIVNDGPSYHGEWKADAFVPFKDWRKQQNRNKTPTRRLSK